MPRQPGEAPPTPDWMESNYLIDNEFDKLAERRLHLHAVKQELESEVSELDLQIGAMLATADCKSVRYGEHRITLGHSTVGGKLSKERLIEVGVTPAQIEAATSPKKPGNNYIRITDINQRGDD